jgi:hypothetical protein
MARHAGVVLLWAGFLWGAFVSVRHEHVVPWGQYAAAALVTALAVVLLRVSARRALTGGDGGVRAVALLRARIADLEARVTELWDARDGVEVHDVRDRIDADLMPPISEFVDARESMIGVYGIEVYAKVMTDFALGERLLNRAWCASADGYVDEVWQCIDRAREAIVRARAALPAE